MPGHAETPLLVRHLAPRNFLSFGPNNAGIDLKRLNLFVGPSGSGKSNVIDAIDFMRSAPNELRDVLKKGSGVAEWIWKGQPRSGASVEWVVSSAKGAMALRHVVSFRALSHAFSLDDERIENEHQHAGQAQVSFYYRYRQGQPVVSTITKGQRGFESANIESTRSILAQRRDPNAYPELAWLAQNYEHVRIYRGGAFGRNAVFRESQKADMRVDALEEDFLNLGLFLNRLKTRFPVARKAILAGLKDLHDGITDFNIFIEGGTVQICFTKDNFVIPATRLSDGTLRYLCLLAILCNPEPPPLICIDEPELGLHASVLPKVAALLRAASQRTQIVVATHSDILAEAMRATPEVVVVCTKQQGETTLERLHPANFNHWLTKYRLGKSWKEVQPPQTAPPIKR